MNEPKLIETMARAICNSVGAFDDEDHILSNGSVAWQEYVDEAQAALSALASAGMAVVPREPTAAMLQAGDDVEWDNGDLADAYRAMLNAATGEK